MSTSWAAIISGFSARRLPSIRRPTPTRAADGENQKIRESFSYMSTGYDVMQRIDKECIMHRLIRILTVREIYENAAERLWVGLC